MTYPVNTNKKESQAIIPYVRPVSPVEVQRKALESRVDAAYKKAMNLEKAAVHLLPALQMPTQQERLQKAVEYIDKLTTEQCPRFSGIIQVAVGDEIVIRKSYAPENLKQKPFDYSMPWNIQSIGKWFTAIAIAQLVEQGKLTLDTPINKILTQKEDYSLDSLRPGYPMKDEEINKLLGTDQITVAHLLTHMGGIIDTSWRIEDEFEANPKQRGLAEVDLKRIGQPNYSNAGFGLLANIVEKTNSHEESFIEYVAEHILKRSGIERSLKFIETPPSLKDLPSHFNSERPSGDIVPCDLLPPPPHGEGCWWLYPEDLFLFARAFERGDLFTKGKETKELMLTPYKDCGNRTLCVDVNRQGVTRDYGHSGGDFGACSHLAILEERGKKPITIMSFSNFNFGHSAGVEVTGAMVNMDVDVPFKPQLEEISIFNKFLKAATAEEVEILSKEYAKKPYAPLLFCEELCRKHREDLVLPIMKQLDATARKEIYDYLKDFATDLSIQIRQVYPEVCN